MQTFVPIGDDASIPFHIACQQIAKCLDYRRLGKQRVEAMQIETAIIEGRGWVNHPATKMWTYALPALAVYKNAMIDEWIARGYRNSMAVDAEVICIEHTITPPNWWGDPRVHSSHRAALLMKDYSYYSQFGWNESAVLNYYWPVGHPPVA